MTKTPIFTAAPVLLENYRFFPNLKIVEHATLKKTKGIPFSKNKGKLPLFIDSILASQDSRLCYP